MKWMWSIDCGPIESISSHNLQEFSTNYGTKNEIQIWIVRTPILPAVEQEARITIIIYTLYLGYSGNCQRNVVLNEPHPIWTFHWAKLKRFRNSNQIQRSFIVIFHLLCVYSYQRSLSPRRIAHIYRCHEIGKLVPWKQGVKYDSVKSLPYKTHTFFTIA